MAIEGHDDEFEVLFNGDVAKRCQDVLMAEVNPVVGPDREGTPPQKWRGQLWSDDLHAAQVRRCSRTRRQEAARTT